MTGNKQNEPNPRVEQLLESLRPVPDAAAAKALKDELVARLSHADSNGRKPDTMATIALPHRDARKSAHRFRGRVGWAALVLVIAGFIATLAVRPPDRSPLIAASSPLDQTDQAAPRTDDMYSPAVIENSEAFSMTSEITGRVYNITVALPDHYNNPVLAENQYPVLYVFDSPFFNDAGTAIAIYTRVAAGRTWTTSTKTELPKLIVVTIALTGDEETFEIESPDIWVDPDKFVSFVSQELVPRIDDRYRTIASAEGRTIAGIGAGIANLVLIAMYSHTDMYSRYLAANPGDSAPGFSVRELDDAFSAANSTLPARLYMTSNNPGTAFFVERWHNMIAGHNYEGFESTYVAYDGPNLVASSFTAVFEGLTHLFGE